MMVRESPIESPTYVGPLEPFEFVVSDQLQAHYLEALQDYHLRYVLSRPGVPPVIHPGILLSQSNATRSPSFTGPNTRWLHMREQTHFTALAHLGDTLIVRWRIEEHEQWFGRILTRVSCVMTRCDGTRVLERTMWGFRSSASQPVPGRRERDRERAAVVGHSARPALTRCGSLLDPLDWEIAGRQKQATDQRIKLFSGLAVQNLHTSEQVAKDAGLPAPVASAAQGMGYLSEFMIDNLGDEWLAGGSWVLTFEKPVFPADQVSSFGRLRSAEPTDFGAQCTLDIQLVNQDGRTVTKGSASGHRRLE